MKAFFLQWIGYFVLSLIYKTNKFEIHGEEYFKRAYNKNRPILLCVWHGRMLFPIFYVIKNTVGLRISEEAEKLGTDKAEVGVIAYSIRD